MEGTESMDTDIKLTNKEETTTNDSETFTEIKEGKAIVLAKGNQVFYNPVQEVNRDLSILMIKMYEEQLRKEKEGSLK